jgi:hypothetical protein
MVYDFLFSRGLMVWSSSPTKTFTTYCDNCGGQNKNNTVLRFAALLTQCGYFKEVWVKFLAKWHTKNACDRGFAHVKKMYVKTPVYTMDQVVMCRIYTSDKFTIILLSG